MQKKENDLCEKHIIGSQTRERLIGASGSDVIAEAGVALVGISDARPGFEFVRRNPTLAQVLVSLNGTGRVWVRDRWVDCGPGYAYITPPGQLHAYHASGDWKIGWVIWWAERVPESFEAWEQPTLIETDVQPLGLAIEGLLCEAERQTPTHRVWMQLVRHYVHQILTPATLDVRLVRLWREVSCDLSKPWDIRTLSRIAGVSTEQLRRLCIKWHGMTPIRYVNQLRMQRATELLVQDDLKIQTIARRVGYDNPFAFSTAFRRITGRRPSELRLKNPPI